MNKLVTDLVNLDRVHSLLKTISHQRKFLNHLARKRAAESQHEIPIIVVDTMPSSLPQTTRDISFAPNTPNHSPSPSYSDYNGSRNSMTATVLQRARGLVTFLGRQLTLGDIRERDSIVEEDPQLVLSSMQRRRTIRHRLSLESLSFGSSVSSFFPSSLSSSSRTSTAGSSRECSRTIFSSSTRSWDLVRGGVVLVPLLATLVPLLQTLSSPALPTDPVGVVDVHPPKSSLGCNILFKPGSNSLLSRNLHRVKRLSIHQLLSFLMHLQQRPLLLPIRSLEVIKTLGNSLELGTRPRLPLFLLKLGDLDRNEILGINPLSHTLLHLFQLFLFEQSSLDKDLSILLGLFNTDTFTFSFVSFGLRSEASLAKRDCSDLRKDSSFSFRITSSLTSSRRRWVRERRRERERARRSVLIAAIKLVKCSSGECKGTEGGGPMT
ncbi:calcium channel protein [Stygiomarasmius scandens]|uniref:Calcium channel protein n=1 Tax=Marasmiellus scandens TaxID=2682957 RepID=A0ABR1J9E3_9AGAR